MLVGPLGPVDPALLSVVVLDGPRETPFNDIDDCRANLSAASPKAMRGSDLRDEAIFKVRPFDLNHSKLPETAAPHRVAPL